MRLSGESQLIAGGKTTVKREALSITIEAVEKYLTSIDQKVGITSRMQLTGYVVSDRDTALRS